jgi:hypothetical protein
MSVKDRTAGARDLLPQLLSSLDWEIAGAMNDELWEVVAEVAVANEAHQIQKRSFTGSSKLEDSLHRGLK